MMADRAIMARNMGQITKDFAASYLDLADQKAKNKFYSKQSETRKAMIDVGIQMLQKDANMGPKQPVVGAWPFNN
jgi:hypothetical protein